jgi:hypothetical protein
MVLVDVPDWSRFGTPPKQELGSVSIDGFPVGATAVAAGSLAGTPSSGQVGRGHVHVHAQVSSGDSRSQVPQCFSSES